MTAPTLTRPKGLLRNTHFTSPTTGVTYWVDQDGKATPVEEEVPFQLCECELDWNCPLHADRLYTALELRNDEWASRQADQDRFFQDSFR